MINLIWIPIQSIILFLLIFWLSETGNDAALYILTSILFGAMLGCVLSLIMIHFDIIEKAIDLGAKMKHSIVQRIQDHVQKTLDPYPNEHAIRVTEPGQCDRMRRENNAMKSDGKRIDVIWCIKNQGRGKKPKTSIQAYRLPAGSWTKAQVKAFAKGKDYIRIEYATGE